MNGSAIITGRKKIWYLSLTLLCFTLAGDVQIFGQEKPGSAGLHRVHYIKEDLSYEFYASIPYPSFKPELKKKYSWYRPDTILTTEGAFTGRILDGAYKEFFSTNNLKTQGSYKKGLKCGLWIEWYQNGAMRKQENWKDGYKEGYSITFNEKGDVVNSTFYKRDLQDGMEITYNDVTKMKDTAMYKRGIKINPSKSNSRN